MKSKTTFERHSSKWLRSAPSGAWRLSGGDTSCPGAVHLQGGGLKCRAREMMSQPHLPSSDFILRRSNSCASWKGEWIHLWAHKLFNLPSWRYKQRIHRSLDAGNCLSSPPSASEVWNLSTSPHMRTRQVNQLEHFNYSQLLSSFYSVLCLILQSDKCPSLYVRYDLSVLPLRT